MTNVSDDKLLLLFPVNEKHAQPVRPYVMSVPCEPAHPVHVQTGICDESVWQTAAPVQPSMLRVTCAST